MNSFDIAVGAGFLIAVSTGFATGLVRSAVTILAYLLAMPIAVWAMSYVPPLDGGSGSPLAANWGFLIVATAAQAQSYTTTVNRETKTVTTSGPGYSSSTTQTSQSGTTTTYTTTITRNPGGYQPMGAGGYRPMGH